MSEESRSLWEVLISETELWRRGRTILILIGLSHFVLQLLILLGALSFGNAERGLMFGVAVAIFWLQFYFVWIGVQWLRWFWGAWDMIIGFCLLIWAWRDSSGFETFAGCGSFVTGFYLCFSPSIYFFAKRQKETVRWMEAIVVSGVWFLILLSIGMVAIGFVVYRHDSEIEAAKFGQEANQRIYVDRDLNWVMAHITKASFEHNGAERLQYFFRRNLALGTVRLLTPARADVRVRLELPLRFRSDARIDANAQTENGEIVLHEILRDNGRSWELDHIWWDFVSASD
jgi:hypothetical protein